jgi:transcriptional regulator with XRE-family HTH domain
MKSLEKSSKERRLLGLAVRARRETQGHSQEKLAELVGCHRNYIGLVERGRQNLSVEMLSRIALALDCKAATLMQEAEM